MHDPMLEIKRFNTDNLPGCEAPKCAGDRAAGGGGADFVGCAVERSGAVRPAKLGEPPILEAASPARHNGTSVRDVSLVWRAGRGVAPRGPAGPRFLHVLAVGRVGSGFFVELLRAQW